MCSKELIERVEELANVYSKVITSLDSKERKNWDLWILL